jgi:mannose-6-phosphate isomerase-like protein (cupin superfamily)
MICSRREGLLLLLAVLPSVGLATEKPPLPSKTYRFEDLPVQKSDGNSLRPVLTGLTHNGCRVELHETTLAPGSRPHPPHHHAHEEMFLIREGTVEVTINGRGTKLGPGGVAFVASNDEHGIRNAGTIPAQYFVLAIGREK